MIAASLPTRDTRPDCVLRAVDVGYSFGPTPALQGARLSVARGEIVAVMGPSGSGKSTLLHCLAGILPPQSGEIWFDGKRLDTLSDARRTQLRRTDFGFVFQFGQLVPELSAADNVALPLLLGGTRRKAAYAAATTWLNRLGLDGLEARRTGELSGGQAQRVAVARALAARPRVIFADEPTGQLDSAHAAQVAGLLLDAATRLGAGLVLATHDLAIAGRLPSRWQMADGRMIAEDVAEDVAEGRDQC